MNKAVIKNFAVEARKKLIASVKDKAGRIGIARENITEAIRKGEGYAVFPTHIGIETTLEGIEIKQRENLVNRIKEKGYESVMEEVAYTWFNRIVAVRFMEVNDYLPSRIRVLSSETKGKFEPDIVTQAPKIDLELTDQENEEIISLKEKNELDKLFRMLFIKQCNRLGEILPELFENTSKYNKDYTEILLDISYTNEDGVIRDLLKIDEADYLEAVEIIGWMYQYYNTEPKDEAFALLKQNVKITKERIPAATQLFTPDWIVRYMVENSLGRLWLEGHPNDTLRADWKYYLDEVEQEPDVIAQLEKFRAEYKTINPEEIRVIDPCMGSGHILVYAFEVLMQIYESSGYTQRDAASLITEKNLYGLDIDDRAYQLAYFAVMMKGRKYDRRFLSKVIIPNLCSIQESNGFVSFEQGAEHLKFDSRHRETANYLIQAFKNAKEFGSILNPEPRDYEGLLIHIEELQQKGSDDLYMSMWLNNISVVLPKLIKQAKIMAQKYDVVVTNPPYMGSSGMGTELSDFVKKNYSYTKSDMSTVFMERTLDMCKLRGTISMINIPVWMFLSSYEKLRENIITSNTFINMVHLGRGVFGSDFGTTAFVISRRKVNNYKAVYRKLYLKYGAVNSVEEKEKMFLNGIGYYTSLQENFHKIPGSPISYWVSEYIIKNFLEPKLDEVVKSRQGLACGNVNNFRRNWFEVNYDDISLNANSIADFHNSTKKFAPINDGGEFRKWYGNNISILKFDIKNYEVLSKMGNHLPSKEMYFQPGITWTAVTSGELSLRYFEKGFLFSNAGMAIFGDDIKIKPILAFLNSKVIKLQISALNESLNFNKGDIARLPIHHEILDNKEIYKLAEKNIGISKQDWSRFETDWNFEKHPFVYWRTENYYLIDTFSNWQEFAKIQFEEVKNNEEELNRIFISIYSLENVTTPEVNDKEITINRANLNRDIRSFISYAVGCMFGRYSLDVEGLAYAGGKWNDDRYKTFTPDKYNIIPITDEEYFDDDIVTRFVRFVKVVYSEDTLEENLDFIANALGNKGSTSREVIRNYFIKDFYKDHAKTYQKCPIYWMFDSGRENGFKAIVYLHRYDEDTVGRVRADYLHKTQAAIENTIAHCDLVLESNAPASDKAKAVKQKEKLVKQLAETRIYDQAIAHIAHQRISLDLDDGVVANYAKFQGIEVSSEGKKSLKVDLLAKI